MIHLIKADAFISLCSFFYFQIINKIIISKIVISSLSHMKHTMFSVKIHHMPETKIATFV